MLTICYSSYFRLWFRGLDLGSDCFSSGSLHTVSIFLYTQLQSIVFITIGYSMAEGWHKLLKSILYYYLPDFVCTLRGLMNANFSSSDTQYLFRVVFKMVTTLFKKKFLLPHHLYRKSRTSKNHLENPVNNQLTILFKSYYCCQNGCKLKRHKNKMFTLSGFSSNSLTM